MEFDAPVGRYAQSMRKLSDRGRRVRNNALILHVKSGLSPEKTLLLRTCLVVAPDRLRGRHILVRPRRAEGPDRRSYLVFRHPVFRHDHRDHGGLWRHRAGQRHRAADRRLRRHADPDLHLVHLSRHGIRVRHPEDRGGFPHGPDSSESGRPCRAVRVRAQRHDRGQGNRGERPPGATASSPSIWRKTASAPPPMPASSGCSAMPPARNC